MEDISYCLLTRAIPYIFIWFELSFPDLILDASAYK